MPSVDGADDDHDMVSDAKYKASTSSTFPQTRVKRIIKEDKDIMNCQNDAVFAVTVATELFLQKFAEMAYNQARKRNAKSIAYGDVASAVQMTERFRFLEDVVPPTVPLRKALKQRETLQKSEEQQHDEEE
ncbi:histone-fold-containing protein [Polychytrium aggregatum]|uniref:histone-fold-containing protein n=1 Tax=Polychytrium aggregatum TaxID=110093 RepID=UPI0022FE3613|nr:histone-fold-containing protein [Polychytrium aggregatum]KAI9204776.1 histone-fold-containing protein [Polychytrium aggregatum]